MEAKLIVVGGDVKASEINLKLPTIIGRGKGATLLLQHPLVSRQHCEIYEHEGQLVVRDMGSLNGTYVNNARLSEPTLLPSGDLLTIGDVTFRAEYYVDPNMKPPEGMQTARISGLQTSFATRPPAQPMPDFAASDDDVDVDFGAIEEVDDATPQVVSLDEIPAISTSNDDFDVMAMLEDDEEAPPAKPAPAVKKPEAKKPEAKKPEGGKPELKPFEPKKFEPKTPVSKQPEAKKPAPPAKAESKPAAPASKGAPSKPAPAGGKGAPSAGAAGSRWSVPQAGANETIRAPETPKPPEASKTPAKTSPPKIAPPGGDETLMSPGPAKAQDDTDDFLADLGLEDAAPAASSTAAVEEADVVAFDVEEVDEIVDVEDVEIEDVAVEEIPVEPEASAPVLEPLATMPTVFGDSEEASVAPPAPMAEAAAAVESPPHVEDLPAAQPPAENVSDADVESFLSDLAEEPMAVDEVEEVEAIDVEEIEMVETEDVSEVEDVLPPAPAAPFAAPPAPAAIVPPPAPAVAPPAPTTPPAAPAKRPHAAPAFAPPYRPAPATPDAGAPTTPPAPPARKPHAAPRPMNGPASVGPPASAAPIAPPSESEPKTPQPADDDLNAFFKGLK
jgi:hypothetical protein